MDRMSRDPCRSSAARASALRHGLRLHRRSAAGAPRRIARPRPALLTRCSRDRRSRPSSAATPAGSSPPTRPTPSSPPTRPPSGSAPSSSATASSTPTGSEYPGLGADLRRARADLQPQLLLRLPRPRRPRPAAGGRRRADGVDAGPPLRAARRRRPHPAYGDQLNDRAILGVPAEGRAIIDYDEVARHLRRRHALHALPTPRYRFADLAYGPLDGALISPRVAPAVIGLGLLEAVPRRDARGARRPRRRRRRRHLRPHQLADRPRRQAGRPLRLEGQCRHAPRAGGGCRAWRHRPHLEPLPGQNCPPPQTACAAAPVAEASRSSATASSTGWSPMSARSPCRSRAISTTPTSVHGDRALPRLRLRGLPHADAQDRRRRGAARAPRPDLPSLHRPSPPRHGRGLADGRPDGSATRQRVADAAALGPRPARARQRPRPPAARRPRPRLRRGDPLARRRGASGARGLPHRCRRRPRGADRFPESL